MKYTYLFFVLIFSTTLAFSQNTPWKTHGNSVNNSAFLGTKNNKPLKFKTNNQLRMKIKKNGDILVKDSMHIQGALNVDNYINVDSIHARSIRVGDHSLWIGGMPSNPLGWGTSDMISSTAGQLGFYNQNGFTTFNLQTLSQMSLTIGGLPVHKLNINDFAQNAVYTSYTNTSVNSGFWGTPQATDGFLVGINATGDAVLNQQENLDMLFCTNNQQKMVLTAGGRVGISATRPITKLHIGSDIPLGLGLGVTNGARDWMNIGTFYYSNTDNMYVGLRYENIDRSDAIINWGDNANTTNNFGPDNLLFIFTSDTSGTSLSSTNNGVEIARMTFNQEVPRMGVCEDSPKARLSINTQGVSSGSPISDQQLQLRIADNFGHSNFRAYTNGDLLINPFKFMPSPDPSIPDTETPKDMGIGVLRPNHPNAKLEVLRDDYQQLRLTHTYNSKFTNFYTTEDGDLLINPTNFQVGINLNPGDPTQAIDAKGNARLRTLPSALFEDTIPDKIVCVEADGTLNWTDASNFGGGGADNDWFNQATQTNITNSVNDDVYTFGNVAIGADASITSRTYIENDVEKIALYINSQTDNSNNYGLYSWVHDGVNTETYAVYGVSNTPSTYNTGVRGEAYGGAATAVNYGIYGKVSGGHPNAYAGYFDGDVAYTGNVYNLSDARFKENVQDITNAKDIISQLSPKSFTFKNYDYPSMSLPSGLHYGLIAQEIEPIFPDLVLELVHPAEYDSLGNIINDSLHYKSIDYGGFIPFLIKGVQELDSINTGLANRVDSLENILNSYQSQFAMLDSLMNIVSNLSYNNNTNSNQNNMVENFEITYREYVEDNNTVLYQNNPNPFKEETEFSYSLAQAGLVLFEIHNEQGKLIQVLADELQTEGKHIIHWDSNNLETGVYIYSLKFNGEILVKKAIKIK